MQHRGTWFIPVEEQTIVRIQHLTCDEIIVEEERKQAILADFEELRAIAGRWSRELWLPPPWQWDIANLEYVFYVDTEKVARGEGVTGYKLPADLLYSEKSQGHFKHFEKGDVCWVIQDDKTIVLKLLVEDDAAFHRLKANTQGSQAWALFTKWKEEAGIYIQFCSSLLARIENDVRRAIRAKSELSWWTIYHDAFCTNDTRYRCETCGTYNTAESRFCEGCHSLLGWLRPILKGYEISTTGSKFSPIHLNGWGNIEESLPIDKFKDILPALKELVKKYQGHDLVGTILEKEKEVKQVENHLKGEIVSL